MTDQKHYHHGDLRAALMMAAEAELEAHGIEAFSLRQVAKRAGVSHAAPAHHFADANGLLTALAAEGYRQFLQAQADREAQATTDPQSRLVASGLGYVDFAISHPALFRLLFGSARTDYADPDLARAAGDAYDRLARQVFAAGGRSVAEEAAVWAMAHGLADLLAAGRLKTIASFTAPERDAVIATILRRVLPGGTGG
ncbi:MAG: TetR/AcrR family transcriptional regulator [Candidatus Saccharibacteria bacterium]|nr:TetR/AcrR family transcriptional regulator [Pseudorhodobacter sp.]